jgi:hypothetical protein
MLRRLDPPELCSKSYISVCLSVMCSMGSSFQVRQSLNYPKVLFVWSSARFKAPNFPFFPPPPP